MVNEEAYDSLIKALQSKNPKDFNAIITGGGKLANPQAAYAYSLIGADGAINTMPAAPALGSAEAAGEMVELYWATLLRDVPFNHYDSNTIALQAVEDISSLSDFKGPKSNNAVIPATLLRGTWKGELKGPYVSQLPYQQIPYHETSHAQTRCVPVAGTSNNFMAEFDEWLDVQNGKKTGRSITFTSDKKFIRTARYLGDFVHLDFPCEAYLHAALILLSYGNQSLDTNNPYRNNTTQGGFVTFGAGGITELLARASKTALKAAWYQKWLVHRG